MSTNTVTRTSANETTHADDDLAGLNAAESILSYARSCGHVSCTWAADMAEKYHMPAIRVVESLEAVFSGSRSCVGTALIPEVILFMDRKGL